MASGKASSLLCCFLVAACSGEKQNPKPDDAGSGGGGAISGAGGSGNGPGSGGVSGSLAGSGPSGGSAGDMAGSGTGGSPGAGNGGTSGSAGVPSGGNGGAGNGGAGGAAGSAGGTPREEALPDLTTVRQEHAVVALAGEIYVIGGYTPNATATVEAYDPVARSWRPIRDLPQALNHANAAAVGDALYVTGFYVGSSMSNTSRQVYSYNPTANEWTEHESMPDGTQRATGCVAVLGNKIYVFGGARGMTVTDASAYDTVEDSWEPLPALAESREHCTAGAIGGIIYIASGRTGGITGFRASTVAFDPGTMMYSPKAPITTPRGGGAGAVLNGRLFVFGGEGNPASGTNGVFANVEAYDPVSNTWEALPPMQIPRHGYGAAALDGRIYLAGGATRQGLGAVNDSSVFYFE
jgi:N-acetylneuraminic acid mutarotase